MCVPSNTNVAATIRFTSYPFALVTYLCVRVCTRVCVCVPFDVFSPVCNENCVSKRKIINKIITINNNNKI